MKNIVADKPKFLELFLIGALLIPLIGLCLLFCQKQIEMANSDRLLPDMFAYMSLAAVICILARWNRNSLSLNIVKWNIAYAPLPLVGLAAIGLMWPQWFLLAAIIYIPLVLWILGRWAAVKKYWPVMIFIGLFFGIHPTISQPIINSLLEFSTKFASCFSQIFLSPDYHRTGQYIVFCPEWMPSGVKSSAVMLIDECSGWRSLIGSLLLAVMFCAASYLNLKKAMLVCIVAGLIAVAGNFLRIAVSLSAIHCGWNNVSSHLGHSALGNIVMIVNALVISQLVRKLSTNNERKVF